jgi:endonuclease VIII
VPEGDTVWRAARSLDRALAGQILTATDFRVPQLATVDLSGGKVLRTLSRGKHLLTRIEAREAWTLHTHLKMEGSWHIYQPGQKWRRPSQEARVVLSSETRQAVGFSLGVVELLPRHREGDVVGHLGPDLLGPDWDEDEALSRLRSDPDRAVHEALLDQSCLAGIGNMYAAELCFTSGIHPLSPVGDVAELGRLVRRARQMLEQNKERSEQSTTGDLRRGRRHWVYRRDRQPCLRCQTSIEVGANRDGRATYWCPSCQPDAGGWTA